jgi:hypothetical protein
MTQVDMPITGDYQTVNNIVGEHAGEFFKHGFELGEVKWEGSTALGYFLVFHFVNQRTNMDIRIAFFPAEKGLNGGFTVMILNPAKHRLTVTDYLKLHGHEEPTRAFTYRDPNTDVRVFAQEFFRTLGELLRNELAPILEGKVWEDIPIDWMGYK